MHQMASGRSPGMGQAFLYNDRVAAALLPALIILVGLAESSVLAILVVRTLTAPDWLQNIEQMYHLDNSVLLRREIAMDSPQDCCQC